SVTPIFKTHMNAVLRDRSQKHAHYHFIKGLQLFQILARTLERDERQAALKFAEDFRRIFAQKHLSRAPLPLQVVDVVNVPYQAGLFKADNMAIFVGFHDGLLVTKPKEKACSCPSTRAQNVAALNWPAEKLFHPSGDVAARETGCVKTAPAFR